MSKKNKMQMLHNMSVRSTQKQFQSRAAAAAPRVAEAGRVRMLVWGATPYVITGFGCVMRKILQGLYKNYPGTYYIDQMAINYHGDFCDEFEITGGPQNGRHMQWPAAMHGPGGTNFFGQPKFLELLRNSKTDYDVIFLFEDPFWVGGNVNVAPQPMPYISAIRQILAQKGQGDTPIVTYFPIDGTPKREWIQNIAQSDCPITYLPFGARECVRQVPQLNGRISIIPHGVDHKEFFPIPEDEIRSFKRAFFGEKFADQFMFLNVNRNQLRKLVPSTLLAFRQFKEMVPESFIFLNMKMQDVGWDLGATCQSLGLRVGQDVLFPPNFQVHKGLTLDELNKVFNAADVLLSTAVGGGWELSLTQAFATKTSVLAPANTSHIDLCGDQMNPEQRRGLLYASGNRLSLRIVFPSDNEVVRPLPDLDDMVSKMHWMYMNPEACRRMEDVAYNWTKSALVWDQAVVPHFHEVFTKMKKVKAERKAHRNQIAVGA